MLLILLLWFHGAGVSIRNTDATADTSTRYNAIRRLQGQ